MFNRNYDHLSKDIYFAMYKESTRGNPNHLLTYGNGKSATQIQDHLCPKGAHRWHNYMKTPNEIKFEEAVVQHYTYLRFSYLTSWWDRCGSKPTKKDVKRCFMLEFDRSKKLDETLSGPVEALLDGDGDDTWLVINTLLWHEIETAVSEFSSAHSGSEMDEQTKDKMLSKLEDYARGVVEAKRKRRN